MPKESCFKKAANLERFRVHLMSMLGHREMDTTESFSFPHQVYVCPSEFWGCGFINTPTFLQQSLRRLKKELWLQPSWVLSTGHEQAGLVTRLPDRSVKVILHLAALWYQTCWENKHCRIHNKLWYAFSGLALPYLALPSIFLAWPGLVSFLLPSSSLFIYRWESFSRSVKCLSSVAKVPALLILGRNLLSSQKSKKLNCTFRVLIWPTVKQYFF